MRAIMLTFIFLFALVFVYNKCIKYECNTTPKDHICAVWDDIGMNLTKCNDNHICDISYEKSNIGICKSKTSYALPGEYCEDKSQCLYDNNCTDHICEGRKINNSCQVHGQCNVELYCYNGACRMPTKHCDMNGIMCKSNEVCNGNECKILGQIQTGEKAVVPSACKTYYISNNECSVGPKLVGKTKNNTCLYRINETNTFEELPICNMDNTGNSFCPLGKGNINIDFVILS